jgi:hypothetical protein
LVNWKEKKKKKKQKNKGHWPIPTAKAERDLKPSSPRMNISQWWLASWLEVVVLPTSRSEVRIAGPVGVALSLELVEKSRKAGHQEICTSRAVS